MSLNRAPWTALVDDDGSNTVGTVWNKNAIKNVILDPTDAALAQAWSVTQRITLTGAQHNLALTIAGAHTVIVCTNASLLTLDGMAGGVDGQQVLIIAAGSQIDLPHAAAGSAVGNRFANTARSGPTSLSTDGKALYQFDATLNAWRLVAHEQGAWITPAFSAADFTNWTVSSGNITSYRYELRGRTLSLSAYISGASIPSTPASLGIVIPRGFLAGSTQSSMCGASDPTLGYVPVLSSIVGANISLFRLGASVNWSAGGITLFSTFSFEVQ